MRNAQQKSAEAATTAVATATPAARASLVATFAMRYGVEADKLLNTLKMTAFKQPKPSGGGAPPEITNEQMMALLVVANEYHLNPFTKEIYAFPAKGGGIVPIISIDGWIRIVNSREELKSIEFGYSDDDLDADDAWISCTIERKDRDKPITLREYLVECRRDTDPWNDMPRRMLRHKALIQCARVAFGYAGVYDPDEGERIRDAMAIDGSASEVRGKPATAAPQASANAPAQLTHVPLDEIRQRIDQIGVPENEFLAHFEIGRLEELQLKDVPQAMEYLDRAAAG